MIWVRRRFWASSSSVWRARTCSVMLSSSPAAIRLKVGLIASNSGREKSGRRAACAAAAALHGCEPRQDTVERAEETTQQQEQREVDDDEETEHQHEQLREIVPGIEHGARRVRNEEHAPLRGCELLRAEIGRDEA